LLAVRPRVGDGDHDRTGSEAELTEARSR